jgi:hypothetical protein
MALWQIKTVSPCINYNAWSGAPPAYNPYLVTPPRIYPESVIRISHFYYDPGRNQFHLWVQLAITAWPSWAVRRYDFDAEGICLGYTSMGIWPTSWVNHGVLGSYGSVYATWNSNYTITEMNILNMWPDTGMWSINPSQWNPSSIFSYALVNREDNLIVGVTSWYLQIWDISGTPTLLKKLRLPYTLGYLCWESREICWIITQNGLVGKINYQRTNPRWEMLSSVQNPEPSALGYSIAFDTKRNRIAVLRWLPDAADGACRIQLEFYRPLYRATGLTDPVPVSPLRTGKIVSFVSQLYGTNGEGVTTSLMNGELQAPAAGTLLNPGIWSDLSGAANFRYQAPAAPASEVLAVSATVTDGE